MARGSTEGLQSPNDVQATLAKVPGLPGGELDEPEQWVDHSGWHWWLVELTETREEGEWRSG